MAITGINYQSRHNLNSGNNTPHGATEVGTAVWIANNSDDQVYRYNSAVAYQSKFALPAGNVQPRGLAHIAKHSKVASLDTGNNRIYLMSETGTDLSENYPLDSANTGGEGILWFESIDELWVADRTDRKWYRYRYTGSALMSLGTYDMHASNTDARGACHIPQDGTAACLNAGTKELFIYDENGAYVRTLSLNSGQTTPRAITVVGFEMWVLDNGSDDVWLYDLVSDVTLTIETGYPNRYVTAIGNDDPADLNDYPIRVNSDVDVSDLTESDITVTGAIVQSFKVISARLSEVRVRPPAIGSGTITVAIGANAVSEGNTAVSASFTYRDTFASDLLFNWKTAIPGLKEGSYGNQNPNSYSAKIGFIVQAKRIRIVGLQASPLETKVFTLLHDGTRLSAEDVVLPSFPNLLHGSYLQVYLDHVNGRWFLYTHYQIDTSNADDRYRTYYSDRNSLEEGWYSFYPSHFNISNTDFRSTYGSTIFGAYSADINAWGLFFPSRQIGSVFARNFLKMQQNIGLNVHTIYSIHVNRLIAQGDRVYIGETVLKVQDKTSGLLLPGEALAVSPEIGSDDTAIYGPWYYYRSGDNLYRLDLEKTRPPRVRSHILPQFLTEGESLPLKYFADGATQILFESDYDVPSWLSIDSNLNLVVGTLPTPTPTPQPPLSGGQDPLSGGTCILVKMRAYSFRGETPLQFYLVVKRDAAPVWKPIETLPVDLGETVNLFEFIQPLTLSGGQTTIAWKSGFTVPSGYALLGGQLTVTSASAEIQLTATNANGSTDKTVKVKVNNAAEIVSSEQFRYRLLIEGIDVTGDLIRPDAIHASLDVLQPNQYVVGNANFLMSSDRGKYDGYAPGNFWDANNLNKNGFLNKIEFYVDIFDTGSVQEKLLFEGYIHSAPSVIRNISVSLRCYDATYFLKKMMPTGVGFAKFATLAKVSENYEGIYAPDASLLPMEVSDAEVVSGGKIVRQRTYKNAPVSNLVDQEAYLTEQTLASSSGYLPEDPLLKFKVPYRHAALRTLITALAESQGLYNPKIEIPDSAPPAAVKHLSSRGNLAFRSSPTKSVHSIVDWIQDSLNNKFYYLLSHPSAYIRDRLEVYDVSMDKAETLTEFDYGVRVCALETANFNDFYIVATDGLQQDPIDAGIEGRNWDESYFDALDSSRETEQTKILKYVGSTDTTTTFLAGNNAYPVQIGLHYMAGFENPRHIRMCEGIVSEARSQFRIAGSYLYYRYAKWNDFGVARVNLSNGTTERLIQESRDEFYNTLNFDFDISSTGDVFMVSAVGTADQSTLRVKRWRSGTVITVYERTDTLTELTEIDTAGGAWLGCHEARLHQDRLYCVLPIQRIEQQIGGGSNDKQRSITSSAGAVLACVNLNSREFTLLERYDYVQLSCRSLTVHQNELVFAEYPNASTQFKPSNPNLPNFNTDTRENTVEPNKTFLKRVVSESATETLISPWYDELPFSATPVRLISDGDDLHAIVRHGDDFIISQPNAVGSEADNAQWVTFGAGIPFFPESVPSGSVFDALVDLAKLANAQIAIKENRGRVVDVDAFWARLSTGLGASASFLSYKEAFKDFPDSGRVLIGTEIIEYTSRSATRLSGLTRGLNGTRAAAHLSGADVLFLDKVVAAELGTLKESFTDIAQKLETHKFYNLIGDAQDHTEIKDADSIKKFGEHRFDLPLPLSNRQVAWRSYLNAKVLQRLRQLRGRVELTMPASYYLDIGNVVAYQGPGGILFPGQIIDLRHTETGSDENKKRETHLIIEEVTPPETVSFGTATVSDRTFAQYSEITSFTLPPAEDTKSSYVYRVEGLPTGLSFDPATLGVSGEPILDQAATAVRYIVVDEENPTSFDELTFSITVTRASLAFVGAAQGNLYLPVDDTLDVTFRGARGGTGLITYAIPSLDSDFTFDPYLRKLKGTKSAAGTVNFSYQATDEASSPASVTDSFSVQFYAPLALASQSNITIIQNTNLSRTLSAATGGVSPFTYTLIDLPSGLSFNASTRQITGVAQQVGNHAITYAVTDALGNSISRTFNIVVLPVLSINQSNITFIFYEVQNEYETLSTATGGNSGNYTYSVAEVSNPNNIDWGFTASTRELRVRAQQAGISIQLRYTVTDGQQTASDTFTVTIVD